MKKRIADDCAVVSDCASGAYFVVPAVFEIRKAEFGSVIEDGNDSCRFSVDLHAAFAQNFDHAFEPAVAPRSDIIAIFFRVEMECAFDTRRRIFRKRHRLRASLPVSPLESLIEIAGIGEDLGPVQQLNAPKF